jgi:D-arabinose 1-dehydrogenase-like Zn-dependent alcohol dehydrogenase
MARMNAVEVSKPGEALRFQQRDVPEPPPFCVRVQVQACGVCHSDSFTKDGTWPGLVYPRVPGHEIAGRIDSLGDGVTGWSKGDRVGVGWHGGHDGQCTPCRRGNFINCRQLRVPGIAYDGGYEEFMIAPAHALARIPDKLNAQEAAPILCAGVTTFNALRNSGARPGDLVAIQGIGGLGHLGVQFANRFGYNTVAIGRGSEPDKKDFAKTLGANHYLDSSAVNPAEELMKLGGADVILATAPDSKSISALVDGLAVRGRLVIVGATLEGLGVSPIQLIGAQRSIIGWPSGTSKDSEEALAFCAMTGVRAMIEKFPLARAAEGYERMITGKVRFRAVLTMDP